MHAFATSCLGSSDNAAAEYIGEPENLIVT
jgi:hypothetical protein